MRELGHEGPARCFTCDSCATGEAGTDSNHFVDTNKAIRGNGKDGKLAGDAEMSYSEKDGTVTLTISRDDYDSILLALGFAAGKMPWSANEWLKLANRINEGNLNWIPYDVKEEPK